MFRSTTPDAPEPKSLDLSFPEAWNILGDGESHWRFDRMTSTSSANGSDRGDPIAMEGTLSKAKKYMQSSDYSRAIVLLQRVG